VAKRPVFFRLCGSDLLTRKPVSPLFFYYKVSFVLSLSVFFPPPTCFSFLLPLPCFAPSLIFDYRRGPSQLIFLLGDQHLRTCHLPYPTFPFFFFSPHPTTPCHFNQFQTPMTLSRWKLSFPHFPLFASPRGPFFKHTLLFSRPFLLFPPPLCCEGFSRTFAPTFP